MKPKIFSPSSSHRIFWDTFILTYISLPLCLDLRRRHVTSRCDYTEYYKAYSSNAECGTKCCIELNYREHYHCLDCQQRTFVKKEELIRHFKWHRKREESLVNGFLRWVSLFRTDRRDSKIPFTKELCKESFSYYEALNCCSFSWMFAAYRTRPMGRYREMMPT